MFAVRLILFDLITLKILNETRNYEVRVILIYHGMARLRVADGGDGPQVWRVAAYILNEQLQTTDKEWSSSL